MNFLGNPVCRSIIGLIGSCLTLGGSFLAGLRICLFLCTYMLYRLKRPEKQTHVHGSHAFLVEVVLILPCVQTHPENVTRPISLGEQNICGVIPGL